MSPKQSHIKKTILGLTVAASSWALGGCMAYNGAWLLPPEERPMRGGADQSAALATVSPSKSNARQVWVPSRPRTSRAQPMEASRMDFASLGEARSHGTGGVVMNDSDSPDVSRAQADRQLMPGWSSSGSRRSSQSLGVYGQVSNYEPNGGASLDGSGNIRRVTFSTEGGDSSPAIDPSGTLLVYASTQHRLSSDLYLKQVNGTAVTQLTMDPANDEMPAFSPDGKRVAFTSDRSGNWDIYMMDVEGGQAVQLTNDPSHDVHPSFSPDGKQLVYSSFNVQSGQWELVVIDTDNPTVKRYIGPGLFPEWSPSDNRILYQYPRERGTRWFSIWTIDLVNGEGVRPTEIAASANAAVITPCWSPDGKFIAFSTIADPDADKQETPPQSDIWIVTADGSGRANLTRSQFANLSPVWAKDGWIYMVSNRAKNSVENIWSIRPDRAIKTLQPMDESSSQSVLVPTGQPPAIGE